MLQKCMTDVVLNGFLICIKLMQPGTCKMIRRLQTVTLLMQTHLLISRYSYLLSEVMGQDIARVISVTEHLQRCGIGT